MCGLWTFFNIFIYVNFKVTYYHEIKNEKYRECYFFTFAQA